MPPVLLIELTTSHIVQQGLSFQPIAVLLESVTENVSSPAIDFLLRIITVLSKTEIELSVGVTKHVVCVL